MNPFNQDLYGNYRNRKFTDVWGDYESFAEDYTNSQLDNMSDEFADSITTLYYLLYARYGNSTIASSDENQFKYKVFTLIFMYGPTWAKRLEIQKQIRKLTIDDLRSGSIAIHNHAFNPSSPPSTQTLEELTYINDQNVQKFKKSLGDAYSVLIQLLDTDVTAYFLDRFRSLFLTVVEPELPLWYETDLEPAEETEGEYSTNATLRLTGSINEVVNLVSGDIIYTVDAILTQAESKEVTINVAPLEAKATVEIWKSAYRVSNGSKLNLVEGDNTYTVTVNAPNKRETYYVTIKATIKNMDATLRLTGGKVAGIGLRSGIKTYTVDGDIPYANRNTVIAEVTPSDLNATSQMTIGGSLIVNKTNLSLLEGNNILKVAITNGSKTEVYDIILNVAAPVVGPVPYKWTYVGSQYFENPDVGDKFYDLSRSEFTPSGGEIQENDVALLPINNWLGRIGFQYDSGELVGYFIEYLEEYKQ